MYYKCILYKYTGRLKVKKLKNIYHTNTNWRKAGGAMQISDKIILKVRSITWDKNGYFIILKKKKTRRGNNNYKFLCT